MYKAVLYLLIAIGNTNAMNYAEIGIAITWAAKLTDEFSFGIELKNVLKIPSSICSQFFS
jgi:hypothetical protein